MLGGLGIRHRERSRFFFFVALNLVLNVGLTIGQGVSEGLFLSHPSLGPALLPQLFIVTAIATAASTFVYAFYVDRIRNDRYFEILCLIAVLVLCGLLAGVHAGATACFMALFSFFYVATGIFNTHFWNYAADYFDAMEAKRLFPYFPLGNSMGGFIGGTLTTLLVTVMSPVAVASLWVLLLLMAFALIRVVSPRLKGWVVTETEESDEASLDNMRQGFLFLKRSSLGRWHLVFALVMITSLFFSQYVYSTIFTKAYPDPEALTGFIGRFLAFTNILELFLELTFTTRLIGLAGVGASNMFHPVSTLVSFALMGYFGNVASAVYGRINRETLDNAIAASCRNLLYNAYPSRLRGRIRALLEGMVTNIGTVIAGLCLMVLAAWLPPDAVTPVAITVGVTLALCFLGVSTVIRHQYLTSLVHGLKEWRLDLDDASLEIEKVEDEELLQLLSGLETSQDPSSLELASKIYRILLKRHKLDTVIERLSHPVDDVKLTALDCLAQTHDIQILPHVNRLVLDGSPVIRRRALAVLRIFSPVSHMFPYLDDADPLVASMAASLVIEAGHAERSAPAWELLGRLLAAPQPASRVAALSVLPLVDPRGWSLLLEHVHDPQEDVRMAALQRLESVDLSGNPTVALQLAAYLVDPSDEVRSSLVRLLSRCDDPRLIPSLVRSLADESYHVRTVAVMAVRRWGDPVVDAVELLLAEPDSSTVDAALAVLGGLESERARERLLAFLARLLRGAHEVAAGMAILQKAVPKDVDNAALEAMRDYVRRACHHAFEAMEQLEDPKVVRNIRRCLDLSSRQARGDALEALSNMGDRLMTGALVALLDDGPLEERLSVLARWAGWEAVPSWQDVVRRNHAHPDRWIRAGTVLACRTLPMDVEGAPIEQTKDSEVMKNLLILKKVPLFAQMSLEQLEVISRIVTEMTVFKGEVIFKESEIGDRLYIIVEGKVSIVKSYRQPTEILLATLRETDYFGEMAVLDNEPRSATVLVEEDTKLLSISGQKLRDIIHQKPEIAFEIFKVLSSRLRRADSKLGELTREMKVLREQQATATPQPEPSA